MGEGNCLVPRRPLESEPIEVRVFHCRGSVGHFCKLSDPSGISRGGEGVLEV